MNEELWNELLKLRAKACLSPNTYSRFERLETYLSAVYTLGFFSQEERENLTAQYKALSDEDRQAVNNHVTNKTNPNLFHLTYEEMELLQVARKDLQFHERARLLSNLIHTVTGTAWLDLGDVFEAVIEVDDNSSPIRGEKPYAHIYFSDGNRRRVETIDIHESVKNNPAAIGHPAIVFAIYHWQRIVYAKRVLERDDVTSRDEFGKAAKEVFGGGRELKIAENNLQAISKLLYVGAKERAIPKESALTLKIELLNLRLEDKDTVFYKAWERLAAKFYKHTDGVNQILAKLETDLISFGKLPRINFNGERISAARVMEFLRAGGKKGGKRFVGYNKAGNWRRPAWKVFRNAFAAWFFDLDQSVVQTYLKRAVKQSVIEDDVYQPSFASPKSSVPRIWHYLLTNPLVAVREPVKLFESDIIADDVEAAIEAASKVTEDEESAEGNQV